MTDNHTELCEWFRREAYEYDNGDNYHSAFLKAAALIESQAARIQQQALEYASLFDQCSQHLARIAELQRELETARQERNAAGVRARQELMPAYESRIAELEADRDCWRDQCSQRVADWDAMRKEREAVEAAEIERCAKFMEARADEIAAADNCTANMMAMIYRDEAKSLRALLPKEEG